MKTCNKCHEVKPVTEFSKNSSLKSGLDSNCRTCNKAACKAYAATNKEKELARGKKYNRENSEARSVYGKKYRLDNLESCKASLATWRAANQDHIKAYVKKQYAENKDEMKANVKAWGIANPERRKATQAMWQADNKDYVKATKKNYRIIHPEKGAFYHAQRRARKLHATPVWANLVAIKCYYQVAAMLTREGLDKWHVDHIVPLQGKKVCGLHVENNLQLLTAKANLSKGNAHFEAA